MNRTLGGPESEPFAKADATIKKTFYVPVLMVPDEEYPSARILSVGEVMAEALPGRKLRRLGVVGLGVMPHALYEQLTQQLSGVELVDITEPYEQLRWFKSDAEGPSIAAALASRRKCDAHGRADHRRQRRTAGLRGRRGESPRPGLLRWGYRTIVASGPRTAASCRPRPRGGWPKASW